MGLTPASQRGESNGLTALQSGYNYLQADTLYELRKVLSKFDEETNRDCYMLCLKILSKIINEGSTNEYSQSSISLYIDCLVAIGPNVQKLSVSEKEMYYSEVKNLIGIIKRKQREFEQRVAEAAPDQMEVDAGNKLSSPD